MKLFWTLTLIGIIIILITVTKSNKPLKQVIGSGLKGFLSMVAVNVTGMLTGVTLSLNGYTALFVAIFGMPGTVTLTILRFIFK